MEPWTTTLNAIREHSPCASGWAELLKSLGKTKAKYDKNGPSTDRITPSWLHQPKARELVATWSRIDGVVKIQGGVK